MKHAFDAAMLAAIMQQNDWTRRPGFLDTSSMTPASFRFPSKGPVTNTMESEVEMKRYPGKLADFVAQYAGGSPAAPEVTLQPGEFRRLDRED